MDTTSTTEPFLLPPQPRNAKGDMRKAGFELEYSGLDVQKSALLVRRVFGGDHVIRSSFEHVIHAPPGDFDVVIDTSVLKEKRYEKALRAVGLDPDRLNTHWLEEALLGVAATLVPIEISAPPIPIDQLAPLDELRGQLRAAGAKGTRASVVYAFGMHINPEVAVLHAAPILDHLRAFILLYPWLKQRAEVDLARRIAPYINPFPAAYGRLILQPDYAATDTKVRLIRDYLRHNPTRNRPLDMMPLLACLDREMVMRIAREQGEEGLVKPRPAYHYRLPNCMVDEDGWTLAREWNAWVAVERLANDRDKLWAMAGDYLQADQESFRPFVDKWPDALGRHTTEF